MAKYLKISDHFILIPGRVAIAFICIDKQCYMIDSGMDEDQARRAIKIIDELSFMIIALINSHSHADHIGGNSFVKKRKNIPIYSSELEVAYIRYPILEPIMLYGGFPPKDLKSKFFLANATSVEVLQKNRYPFQIIYLSGHSPNMIGFIVDDIFFVADAYIDPPLLKKHVIPYSYDPSKALKTLENLLNIKGYYYIPSHGSPSYNPEETILSNIKAIKNVRSTIESVISKDIDTDTIVSKTLSKLDVNISSVGLYYLYKSTIMAYLTWLESLEIIHPSIKNNRVYWRAIKK